MSTHVAAAPEVALPPPSYPTEYITEIPVDQIDRSPTNPRRNFNEQALEELKVSILAGGLVHPIIVRSHPENSVRFQLVAGERRWLATRRAGKETIPAIVRELSDEQVLVVQIIENDQRANLNPLEQGQGFKSLMEMNPAYYTVEEISARTGLSPRDVVYRLQLLELIEPAQRLLAAERLPFRHAVEIARLQTPNQQEALSVCFRRATVETVLANTYQTVSISLADLRAWIATNCLLDLAKARFDTKADNLVEGTGPCTTCPKRSGSNPVLFAEIAEDAEKCTDPECFKAKTNALVQIQVKSLEQEGKTPIVISYNFRMGGPEEREDILYRGQYRIVQRDSCEFVQPGIYSEDSPQTGQSVYICATEDCPVHSGVSRYATPEEARERKARSVDQKAEKAYRALLLDEILKKVSKVARKDDVCLVAKTLLRQLSHADRMVLFKTYKWDAVKSPGKHGSKHVDYVQLATKRLEEMGAAQLMQFLVVASLAPDLTIPVSNPGETLSTKSALAETARRHGIDLKEVRKRAAAQSTPVKRAAK